MKIDFPAREAVVKQVQAALRQTVDGDDGRETWLAIGQALPLSPLPIFTASRFRDIEFREYLVARVQRALGNIEDDGHDGQETWAALAERFDSLLTHAKPAPPVYETSHPTAYKETVRGRTPNRNRGTNQCLGICIHHASGYFEGTVSWCMKAGTYAGYHCLVNTDGERAIMAADTDCAHHAGKSSWRGKSSCNGFLLGLAFIGNTNDGAMRGAAGKNLTDHEVASACEWIRRKMKTHRLTTGDITAHRIVSPGRKDDTSLYALNQILAALD